MVAPLNFPPYIHEPWGAAEPIKTAINNVSSNVAGTLSTLHAAVANLETHTGVSTSTVSGGPTPEQRIAVLEAQVQTLSKQVEALTKRLADIPQSPTGAW